MSHLMRYRTHSKVCCQSNDVGLVDALDTCQSTVEVTHVIVIDPLPDQIWSLVFKSFIAFDVAPCLFGAERKGK